MVCDGELVQKTPSWCLNFLNLLHASSFQTPTTTNMEKGHDNVETLPATDPYLGVEEDLEHTGKNKWARLWPVIVSAESLPC